jgi:sugar/nucleoside kinase (ribokinase family)
MSLLVTGSIGIDTVKTPYGESENCIGGSAVYFGMSASYFSPVRFLGAVGKDCPFDLKDVFKDYDVDLTGLEIREDSKTFRWKGSYHDTMEVAITDDVELNVLAEQPPAVPKEYADSEMVFLANTAPALQMQLLDQLDNPQFVAADTMNCWIEGHLDELKQLLSKIDCLIINEDEARALAGEHNLIKAAKVILDMGPKLSVIKKGESGSVTRNKNGDIFILPAFPAEEVKDPTGAGDTFAGGFMGYLSSLKASERDNFESIKKAVGYGTVASSFTISDFSLGGLESATREKLDERFEELRKVTSL